ncbi:hypothetical protein CBR_g50023 [Chara braunii]|uniref:Importin N-terminal domain-containing protein n=1 Tax=Chara braunii TaxID=69332 RepID=A0A388K599_CHABU|nr:hypothetical protein CBR_g50023 [Chara braunii]|eukprot:GBG65232.1 hypothetical protein CBR_g50023 [Chara braunii]
MEGGGVTASTGVAGAPSEETLRNYMQCFLQTLASNPEPRRQAEAFLKNASLQPGYGTIVLSLLTCDFVNAEIRQAAAVNFKNYIKARWAPATEGGEGGAVPIQDAEKEQIKSAITQLMLNTPPLIQAQLSEALSIISNEDFPDRWQSLLPDLVSQLNSSDPAVINGVLQTANSIFKRFRYQVDTPELARQLKYVLDLFTAPMLALFKRVGELIAVGGASMDPATLKKLLESQRLICRIFFSLNWLTLPEVFEDHLDEWMSEFRKYLVYDDNGALAASGGGGGAAAAAGDRGGESVLDRLKAAICENINLYMEKYEEEFQRFLPTFVSDVWTLLLNVGTSTARDAIATTGIKFLTTVSRSVHHALFQDPEIMKKICENIVIPSLRIREEDEELFEMNPTEYIQRDIEGSDVDTRRRMACELVKGLAKHYEGEVTRLLSVYVGAMLGEYAADPARNWKAKDCAIYLIVALAVKQKTAAQGATLVNALVDVAEVFRSHIKPELEAADVNASPILKADALKFLMMFRSQLPKPLCLEMFTHLTRHLVSESNVVHSYAACCIERLLVVKDVTPAAGGGNQPSTGTTSVPRFGPADVAPIVQPVLSNLFTALTLPDSNENMYVMKCIMRVSSIGDMKPYALTCIAKLAEILGTVLKNPTQPVFNHYLFESMAALIKHVGTVGDPAAVSQCEALLFPVFQSVLEQDVAEFAPYVFQILAQLIEMRSVPLPQAYMALFAPLLSPVLWERPANVEALVRLLQAYLQKAPNEIIQGNQLPAVLGVFQKLLSSKQTDHHGLFILNTIVENLSLDVIQQHMAAIWSMLFYRLQNSRTVKLVKSIIIFMSLFVVKNGPISLVNGINAVQPGLFDGLLRSIWIASLPSISGKVETKLASVAMTRLMCEVPALLDDGSLGLWASMLDATVTVLQKSDEEKEAGTPVDEEDLEERGGYTVAYAKLYHASKAFEDPVPDVRDGKQFLATSLARLSASRPGRIPGVIQQSVPTPNREGLQELFRAANVTLV